MKAKKALIDFSHYKDDELFVKGTHISDSLNGNPSFMGLAAKVLLLQTALGEYGPALAAGLPRLERPARIAAARAGLHPLHPRAHRPGRLLRGGWRLPHQR